MVVKSSLSILIFIKLLPLEELQQPKEPDFSKLSSADNILIKEYL